MKHLSSTFLINFISILGLSHFAHAQFIGVGADVPLSYSNSDSQPQGVFVQITHTTPFLPNLNMGFFSFEKKFESSQAEGHNLQVDATASLIELFYHVPVPLLSLGFGLGGGSMLTRTEVVQNNSVLQKANTSGQIIAWFVQLGIPFWNTIELHASYHQIQAKDHKLLKTDDIELIGVEDTQDLSGTLIAFGFQIAF